MLLILAAVPRRWTAPSCKCLTHTAALVSRHAGNADRLPCADLGWRGNTGNVLLGASGAPPPQAAASCARQGPLLTRPARVKVAGSRGRTRPRRAVVVHAPGAFSHPPTLRARCELACGHLAPPRPPAVRAQGAGRRGAWWALTRACSGGRPPPSSTGRTTPWTAWRSWCVTVREFCPTLSTLLFLGIGRGRGPPAAHAACSFLALPLAPASLSWAGNEEPSAALAPLLSPR